MSSQDRYGRIDFPFPQVGLVTSVSPRQLPPGALEVATNVELDFETGKVALRRAWALSGHPAIPAGHILLDVFEFPMEKPTAPPSIPVMIVTTLSSGTDYSVKAWLSPWFSDGSGWTTDTWKFLGTVFTFPVTTVSLVPLVDSGVLRLYGGWGVGAERPDHRMIVPAFVGFEDYDLQKFKSRDGHDFSKGTGHFLAPLPLYGPSPSDDSVVTLTPELLELDLGDGLPEGSRVYRVGYLYDGYQYGGLGEPVSIRVPSGRFIVSLDLSVAFPRGFLVRPTHILVYVARGEEVKRGPAAFHLLDRVSIEDASLETEQTYITASATDEGESMLSFLDAVGGVPVENPPPIDTTRDPTLIPSHLLGNPVNEHRIYAVQGEQESGPAIAVRLAPRSVVSGVTRLHAWLGRVEAGDFGAIGGSLRPLFLHGPASLLQTDGVFDDPDVLQGANFDPTGFGADRILFIKASDTEDSAESAKARLALTVGRYCLLPNKAASQFPYLGSSSRQDLNWAKVSIVLDIAQFLHIRFEEDLPSDAGVVAGGVVWAADAPQGDLYNMTTIDGTSFIQTTRPTFAEVAGGDPKMDLEIEHAGETYSETELDEGFKCAVSTTMFFTRTDPNWVITGVEDVTGGWLNRRRWWTWNANPSAASVPLVDAVLDKDLETLQTYEELAQTSSFFNWARGRTATRLGGRVVLGGVSLPDPVDPRDEDEETEEPAGILYSGFTGDGVSAPDHFPPTNFFRPAKDGARIVAMAEQFGRAIVFAETSASIVALGAGNSAPVQVEREIPGLGLVAPGALTNTRDGLIWLTSRGLVMLAQSGQFAQIQEQLIDQKAGGLLDLIRTRGARALVAWDSERDLVALYFPGATSEESTYGYHRFKSGGWSQVELGYRMIALRSRAYGGLLAAHDSELLDAGEDESLSTLSLRPPTVTADLGEHAYSGVVIYPTIEPGGGDRVIRVMDASLELQGTVGVTVEVEGRFKAKTFAAGHDRVYRARFPVSLRGRWVRPVATFRSTEGVLSASSLSRLSLTYSVKGRVRTPGLSEVT